MASQHIIAVSTSPFLVVDLLFLILISSSILSVASDFILSWLSCFALSFCLPHASFLFCLTLHRWIASTQSISPSFLALFVQYMDLFSSSWIPSIHMFWRLLKTDSNILWCQKMSVSIIFMICDMITRSYLCRFDSKGVKSIPSIVLLLYSSTTFCRSTIWCM